MIPGSAFPYIVGAAALLSLVLGRVLDSTFLNLFGVLLLLVAFISSLVDEIFIDSLDRKPSMPSIMSSNMHLRELLSPLFKMLGWIFILYVIVSCLIIARHDILDYFIHSPGSLFIVVGFLLLLKR